MRPHRSKIWFGFLAACAWLTVALPTDRVLDWLPPERYEFALPRVNVPYTPGSDVVSGVPDLFSSLALCLVSILLAELAKVILLARIQSVKCHVLIVLYQMSLLLDVFRKHTWDWYGYLLYFSRLISLSYDRPRPELIPIPSPWLSFLLLIACIVFCFWTQRPRTNDASGVAGLGGDDLRVQ